MYRTRQIRIRKGHRLWDYSRQLCRASAVLYNRANFLMRQYATAVRDLDAGKELTSNQQEVYRMICALTRGSKYAPRGQWLTYGQLDYILRATGDTAYRGLPAQANQQILKRIQRDYKSFFEAMKLYGKKKESFTGRPKLPGYKKREAEVTAVLTNQICRIKEEHYIKFPGTKEKLNLGPVGEEFRLKEVRIKPYHDCYEIEVVLELQENACEGRLTGYSEDELMKILEETTEQTYRVASIDPGVNNFCAIVNNFGEQPFLIRGGLIKSENRYYNKKLAELKSKAKICNDRLSTRRIQRLTDRRNRVIKDLMHKVSRKITEWAAENRVDLVVLGHNVFQKQRAEMGHVENQNFIQIPYSMFAEMLRYKLKEKGIAFLETEESYTSKADYLAKDVIPVYGKEKDVHLSGKRIRRGLYLHKDGTISNADINGAANILRKVFPNVTEWNRGVVDTPYVVKAA